MAGSIYTNNTLAASRKEIRLLLLEPSENFNATLRCTLQTVSLDENPNYDALSWCWGIDDENGELMANDTSFPCKPNLESALRHLRDEQAVQALWVDAVCINQKDRDEKSWQILLMGSIYSQAQIVKVWLGEATPDSEEAVDALEQFQAHARLDMSQPTKVRALVNLFQRSWWTRIWVVQEVLLAQTVVMYCGTITFEFSFADLDRILRQATIGKSASITTHLNDPGEHVVSGDCLQLEDDFYGLLGKAIGSFIMAQSCIGAENPPISALMTMLWLGPLQATDLRDKVFGCLGMLPEIAKRIKPDYTASLAKVYSVATYSFIHYLQTLQPLCYHQKSIRSGLPSWSLRYDREGEIHPLLPRMFRACGSWGEWQMPSRFPIPDCDGVILTVNGSHLDTIVACHPTFPDWTKYFRCQSINKWLGINDHYLFCHRVWRNFFGLDYVDPSTCSYIAGGSLEAAYWSTVAFGVRYLNGSKDLRRLNETDITTIAAAMQHHNDHHTRFGKGPITEREEPSRLVQDYDFGVMAATARDQHPSLYGKELHGTCLFTTAQGYIGLALHEVLPGDQVFILHRATLPMILRVHEIDETLNNHEVISACYVHGVMDGEAFESPPGVTCDDNDQAAVEGTLRNDLPLKRWDDIHLL